MADLNGTMTGLNRLRGQGRITWSEPQRGWLGIPAEILDALVTDGYNERKRETTASHGDGREAGGLWQGVNASSGSVAAAIWVARPSAATSLVFIQIDGELVARPGREPGEEEGGES